MKPSPQTNETRRQITRADPMYIVLNIRSGSEDVNARIESIRKILTEAGQNHEIFTVDMAQQLSQTARQAVSLAQKSRGVVIAAGGDGTITTVAREVLPSGLPFGVLPHGTFNYFSRAHGIPSDITEATRTLLHAAPRPIQVGSVNQQIFLVNTSLGAYAQVFEDREFYKQQLGRSQFVALGALLVTLFRTHRNLTLRLATEDRTQEIRATALVVGNNPIQLERLGIPDLSSLQEDCLIAVVAQSVKRLEQIWLVCRGALGRLGQADKVVSFPFKRLIVDRRFSFRHPRIKAALDGELTHLSLPLMFEVEPTPLWLLSPPPSASPGERA